MPKPRTAEVVIYTDDYLDRIRHIERQHEAASEAYDAASEAEAEQVRRVGQTPESSRLKDKRDQLAAEHDALAAEAEAAAIRVRVTTVRRRVYRTLADEHPPREDDKGDKALGINVMTFREALVPVAIVEVTEGGKTRAWSDFSSDEREEFLDTVAESDFERLFSMAYGLVNGFTEDPKLLGGHASPTSQESAAT